MSDVQAGGERSGSKIAVVAVLIGIAVFVGYRRTQGLALDLRIGNVVTGLKINKRAAPDDLDAILAMGPDALERLKAEFAEPEASPMFRLGVLEVMRAKADAASLAFVRKAAGHEAISTRLYAYRALVFKSKDGTAPLLAAADAEEFMAERLKVEPAPVRANMLRGLGVSGLSSEGVDRIAVSQLKDVDVGVRFHSLNLLIRNSKLKPVLRDPDIRQPAAVWDPYADKIVAWVGDGAKAEDVPVFPQTAAAKGAVEGATKKLADGAAKTMSGAMRAAEGAMKSTASRPVGGPGK